MILSYSGSCVLQDCERKFCFKYLAKIPKDPDFVDPDYFTFGQAFHKILELLKHDPKRYKNQFLENVCHDFALDYESDGAKLAAMLRAYWPLHLKSGLDCVGCEIKFQNSATMGFVDVVMSNEIGQWYIVDLKTASSLDDNLPTRLWRDPQLNMYAAFRGEIALNLGLDPSGFAGVKYREITKPRQDKKEGETFDEYTVRCKSIAREISIPANKIDSTAAFAEFGEYFKRACILENEFKERQEIVGRCNFKACLTWGRPCEYFSRCYGNTFTESKSINNISYMGDK